MNFSACDYPNYLGEALLSLGSRRSGSTLSTLPEEHWGRQIVRRLLVTSSTSAIGRTGINSPVKHQTVG